MLSRTSRAATRTLTTWTRRTLSTTTATTATTTTTTTYPSSRVFNDNDPANSVEGTSAFSSLYPAAPSLSHLSCAREAVDLVIYHAGCYDGMGAAWSAWKLLGDDGQGNILPRVKNSSTESPSPAGESSEAAGGIDADADAIDAPKPSVQYKPMTHHRRPPSLAGRNVAMVDIALTRPWMMHAASVADSLVVLDHHVSSEAQLHDTADEFKVFDMEHAGATLSWLYFQPERPVPLFLRYIEDRDIWRWALPDSLEFNTAMCTRPLSFESYEEVYQGGQEAIDELIESGRHMLKFANRAYQSIVNRARVRTLAKTGHKVLVVNSPVFKTEVGNLLAEKAVKMGQADMALVWNFDHQQRNYWCSLRCVEDKVNVAEVAELFEGGGHPAAAAFTFRGRSIEELFEPPKPRRKPEQTKPSTSS